MVGGQNSQEVDEAKARKLAEDALLQMGVEPSALRLKFDREGVRWFEQEYAGFLVQDLTLRHIVEVSGGKVINAYYNYVVPEGFSKWRSWQTEISTLLTVLSLLLSFALLVMALIFLFVLKGKRPYQSALWLSLLMLGLFLFSNFNQWPLFKQQVLGEGGGSLSVLVVGSFAVLLVVILSVLLAAATYPMILTGGLLVQQVKPRLWTSRHDPNWPQIIRKSVWYGYLLAMVWLSLQAFFYWLGESYFDVWYEQDYTMSPSNMWWPLLFPLLAWLAGIQEEITYRLFGVTFFKRYLKHSFVAVLLPAMVWALGHSLYPVYPIYTRFVELTIFGVIIGFCYLWFGIETVIFAHVIFDTVLMSIPLLLSGEALQVGSAILFLLLPVLVGYGLGLLRPRSKGLENV